MGMKTQWQIALDEAAKECGFNSIEEVTPFQSKYPYSKVHQRASEIYAMKFKAWSDIEGWKIGGVLGTQAPYYINQESEGVRTEKQLLEQFNQPQP